MPRPRRLGPHSDPALVTQSRFSGRRYCTQRLPLFRPPADEAAPALPSPAATPEEPRRAPVLCYFGISAEAPGSYATAPRRAVVQAVAQLRDPTCWIGSGDFALSRLAMRARPSDERRWFATERFDRSLHEVLVEDFLARTVGDWLPGTAGATLREPALADKVFCVVASPLDEASVFVLHEALLAAPGYLGSHLVDLGNPVQVLCAQLSPICWVHHGALLLDPFAEEVDNPAEATGPPDDTEQWWRDLDVIQVRYVGGEERFGLAHEPSGGPVSRAGRQTLAKLRAYHGHATPDA